MQQSPPVIAIDGHAGAGKSTVSERVAEELGFWHVNTGLFYRALTWLSFERGLAASAQAEIESLAERADIEVNQVESEQRVSIAGEDITDRVRSPQINRHISQISAYPGVRQAITQRLRELKHPNGIIMDGRDIGTVVYPHADLKIFLTASVEVRARRQHEESLAKGVDMTLEDFQRLVSERDRLDSERKVAPLRQAEDAVLLDSTHLLPHEVVAQILRLWQARAAHRALH